MAIILTLGRGLLGDATYQISGPVFSDKEIFSHFPYISLGYVKNVTPGAGPFLPPGM